jgi:hypothetical protein
MKIIDVLAIVHPKPEMEVDKRIREREKVCDVTGHSSHYIQALRPKAEIASRIRHIDPWNIIEPRLLEPPERGPIGGSPAMLFDCCTHPLTLFIGDCFYSADFPVGKLDRSSSSRPTIPVARILHFSRHAKARPRSQRGMRRRPNLITTAIFGRLSATPCLSSGNRYGLISS